MVKGKKMEKESGSAIILAILLLSVFTALSMNMYYLSEKKGERAVIKAQSKKSESRIDVNVGLAYYENAIAQEMFTNNNINLRRTVDWEVSTSENSDFFTRAIDGNLATANAGVFDSATGIFTDLTKMVDILLNGASSIGGYKFEVETINGKIITREYVKDIVVLGPYKDKDSYSTEFQFMENRFVYLARFEEVSPGVEEFRLSQLNIEAAKE